MGTQQYGLLGQWGDFGSESWDWEILCTGQPGHHNSPQQSSTPTCWVPTVGSEKYSINGLFWRIVYVNYHENVQRHAIPKKAYNIGPFKIIRPIGGAFLVFVHFVFFSRFLRILAMQKANTAKIYNFCKFCSIM